MAEGGWVYLSSWLNRAAFAAPTNQFSAWHQPTPAVPAYDPPPPLPLETYFKTSRGPFAITVWYLENTGKETGEAVFPPHATVKSCFSPHWCFVNLEEGAKSTPELIL